MATAGGSGQQHRLFGGHGLYGGFADALALAFELALTPMVFALLGWWLDGWLGTRPLFTASLSGITAVYVLVKAVLIYKAKAEAEEEGKPWTRRRR